MTSAKAIAANRRNAQRSTGPRTAEGKRKVAANNALRHGLAISVPDAAMSATVARIAEVLAGPGAAPGKLALVMPIAEAQAEVLRARNMRVAPLNLAAASLSGPDSQAEAIYQSLETLTRLDRYERRAMARRNRALCDLRNFQTEE